MEAGLICLTKEKYDLRLLDLESKLKKQGLCFTELSNQLDKYCKILIGTKQNKVMTMKMHR
jgi:hypothetical protein